MKTKIRKGVTEIQDWMLLNWFTRKCCAGLVVGSGEELEQFDVGKDQATRGEQDASAPTHQSLRCHIAMCCASDNPCLIKQSLFLRLVLAYELARQITYHYSKFFITTDYNFTNI